MSFNIAFKITPRQQLEGAADAEKNIDLSEKRIMGKDLRYSNMAINKFACNPRYGRGLYLCLARSSGC
jgi:hypothetical protein